MFCPFCGERDTKVVDSRLAGEGDKIRRRRECTCCNERFTTYEAAELVMPRVIKRAGNRVPFSEESLRTGILKSLEKRPVSIDQVEEAVSRIKHRLRTTGEREVASRQIGEWVMDELKGIDEVAYVRFASVYRSFEDVEAFRREIDHLHSKSFDLQQDASE